MRETLTLLFSAIKEIAKSLPKPIRVLIISLMFSIVVVMACLCYVIYWQRGDINYWRVENTKKQNKIDQQDDVIEAKNKQLVTVYTDLIVRLEKQNAEIQNLKK